MELFKELLDYGEYLKENPFHQNLEIDVENFFQLDKKIIREKDYSVTPNIEIPYSAELDDLIRLHYLVTSRKVITVLEIGVGNSTIVLDHALEQNKLKYGDFVKKNLRRSNPFECHSVDNNEHWIDITKLNNPSLKNVTFHYCPCHVTTFNQRICTLYDNLPNIVPNLIYLDAPDQFSPTGDVNGISTRNPDRLPMSADILTFEHFLHPGTLIVVDGRTANARFLKINLQRKWKYRHFEKFDQSIFYLDEKPLGKYNREQLRFYKT